MYVHCSASSSMENEIMTLSLSLIILQDAMLAAVKVYLPEHLGFHSSVKKLLNFYIMENYHISGLQQ